MADQSSLLSLRLLAAFATLIALNGCARPAGVVFEPLSQPLVWPAPPERARIRYVGQLATSADLKPAVPFGQGLGEALFGKKQTHSMLTPYAVCTDNGDRVFIADSNAQVVHVFDLQARRYEKWAPSGTSRGFSQPVGIAYDPAGRLFVADGVGGVIFIFDQTGRYQGEIGTGSLQRPCGLAFDARNSRLLVADTAAHQVVIMSPAGEVLTRLGGRGTDLGRFNYPTNVALDSQGRIYVSDSLNFRVQQFTPGLKPLRQIGQKGDMPGYFAQPKGLALDTEDHLYVVDAQFEVVQIFDDQGRLLMDFGQEGNGPGEFWLPCGIFIDARNRIWLADPYNRRVQVMEYLPEKQS